MGFADTPQLGETHPVRSVAVVRERSRLGSSQWKTAGGAEDLVDLN